MDFDRFAGKYTDLVNESASLSGESSEYFVQYKADYLARVLGQGPWKLLDFGCGVGTLSSALRTSLTGSTLHGFDVSAASIEKVDPRLRASGVFTTDLNCLDSDYNVVVISNVLHHIEPQDRARTVRELANRLAPAGRILVFEHNPLNPFTRWVVAHCPFDEDAKLVSPGEVSRYFESARVKRVRRDYIVFFPKPFAALRPLEPALGWCPAGAQYAMLGRKDGGA